MTQIANALLKIGQTSDADAWKLIVKQLGPSMWKVSKSVLYDDSLAEDSVQESFLQVKYLLSEGMQKDNLSFKKFDFKNDTAASAWVLRVTFFTAKNMMRSRNNKIRNEQNLNSFDNQSSSEAIAIEDQEELHKELTRGIQALPEKLREPLMLKYFSGLTYQSISDLMGSQVSTIKSRVQKGISLLKGKLIKQSVVLLGLNINALLESLEASSRNIMCDQQLLSLCDDLIHTNQLPIQPLNNAALFSPHANSLIGEIFMLLKSTPGIMLLSSVLLFSAYVLQSKDQSSPVQDEQEQFHKKERSNKTRTTNNKRETLPNNIANNTQAPIGLDNAPLTNKKPDTQKETGLHKLINQLDPTFLITILFPDVQRSLRRYKQSTYSSFYNSAQRKALISFVSESDSFPQNSDTLRDQFVKSIASFSIQLGSAEKTKINVSIQNELTNYIAIFNLEENINPIWEKLENLLFKIKLGDHTALSAKQNHTPSKKVIIKYNDLLIIGLPATIKYFLKNKNKKVLFKNQFQSTDIAVNINFMNFKDNWARYFRGSSSGKEQSSKLRNFLLGNLKNIQGNFTLGKNKIHEDVEFNFDGQRKGYWSLLHLKTFPSKTSFAFPKDSFEKTRVMFDLTKMWKCYQELIIEMSQLQMFLIESSQMAQMNSGMNNYLKSYNTSIEEIISNQLTGEIRGWVILENNQPVRYLWLGLKHNEAFFTKISSVLNTVLAAINLSVQYSKGGLLVKQIIPKKLLVKQGKLLSKEKTLPALPKSKQAFSIISSNLSMKFGFELLPGIMPLLRNSFALDEYRFLRTKKDLIHSLFHGNSLEIETKPNQLGYQLGGYLSYTTVLINEIISSHKKRVGINQHKKASNLKPYTINYKNGKPMIRGFFKKNINSNYNFIDQLPDEFQLKFSAIMYSKKTFFNTHKRSMEGKWSLYHANGVKHFEGYFNNGLPMGTASFFDENNKKIKESRYSEFGKEGLYFEWFPNGQIFKKADFHRGRCQNFFKQYNAKGQIIISQVLINHHLWQNETFSDKGVCLERYFRSNKTGREGEYYRWSLTEQILENGQYKNNSKVDKWTGFYSSGEPEYEINYHQKGNGPFLAWHKNGEIKSKGQYKNHSLSGPWKYYWPKGTLKFEGKINQGQKVGTWKLYHSNGNLMIKLNFFSGSITYPIKLYNQKGELVLDKNAPKGNIPAITAVPSNLTSKFDVLAGYPRNKVGPFQSSLWYSYRSSASTDSITVVK